MPSLLEILVAVPMLIGTFLIFVTCLGLLRLPDVFCRMHAAGKAGTMGMGLLTLAAVCAFVGSDQAITLRGLLAIVFQFVTSPTATHILARACYLRDYPRSDRTAVDELRAFLPSEPNVPFRPD
jgi:multicomponent Na+:H+ antiporter subunit G